MSDGPQVEVTIKSITYYDRVFKAGPYRGTVEWLSFDRWEARRSPHQAAIGHTPKAAVHALLKKIQGGF